MKKKLILLLFCVIFILGSILFVSKLNQQPKGVHYHAGFLVYVDGKLQDLSDEKYMDFEKCTEENGKLSPAEEQEEKAHLHDRIGNVVHVHRSGAIWGDLFKNINFEIPKSAPITGYVTGKSVNDILNQPITQHESVIIVIGSDKDIDLSRYVSQEHIIQVEKTSELCAG